MSISMLSSKAAYFVRSTALKNIRTISRVRERVWHLFSLIQELVEILHFVFKWVKPSFSKRSVSQVGLEFSFKYNYIKQKHFFHIPFRTTLHQSYSYCSFPEHCLRLLTFSRKLFRLDRLEHGTKISGTESWTSPRKQTSKTWEESFKYFLKRQVIMSISAWTMIHLITAFQFLYVQG